MCIYSLVPCLQCHWLNLSPEGHSSDQMILTTQLSKPLSSPLFSGLGEMCSALLNPRLWHYPFWFPIPLISSSVRRSHGQLLEKSEACPGSTPKQSHKDQDDWKSRPETPDQIRKKKSSKSCFKEIPTPSNKYSTFLLTTVNKR